MSSPSAGNSSITTGWFLFLWTIIGACSGLIYTVFRGDGEPLYASLGFGGLGFATTYIMIIWLGPPFMRVGFKGRDRSKRDQKEMCAFPPQYPPSPPPDLYSKLTMLLKDLKQWVPCVPSSTSSS